MYNVYVYTSVLLQVVCSDVITNNYCRRANMFKIRVRNISFACTSCIKLK